MKSEIFKHMNEQINPSNELISLTKSAMRKKCKATPISYSHIIYRYGVAVACFILIIVSVTMLPNLTTRTILPPTQEKTDFIKNQPKNSSKIKQDNNVYGEKINTDEKINLTKKEMYKVESLGKIVPKTIFPNYSFENATIIKNKETGDILNINFRSGYNYIEIKILNLSLKESESVVSVKDKEKYNITKYSIPLAASIPSDLYETMLNPIFKSDELTEDALQLRKYSIKEQGEGSKSYYIMKFGVLCGDKVIKYNIKGTNLEHVFKMVTSSEYFKN